MWAARTAFTVTQFICSASSTLKTCVVARKDSPCCVPSLITQHNTSYRLTQYRLKKTIVYNKITKNKLLMNKKRDSGFENVMDEEKPMRIMKRLIALLMKQPERKLLYRFLIRKAKQVGIVKPQRVCDVIRKYPHIISIFREPDDVDYWVTVANPVLFLMEEEKQLKQGMVQAAVLRLRKVLMMSVTRRIPLDTVALLSEELGLPDDFKKTVIKANPHLFKLVKSPRDVGKEAHPKVRLLEWDPQLAVPAVEEYRQRKSVDGGPYSFPISFPPSFKVKISIRYKLRHWQRISYRSPYEDTRDLDMKSPEAAKRAVAVIHEFLHITVGHRTQVDRLARLRMLYKLPVKIGVTVLQNPGVFYMSIKSNVHTIFLREAFKKGEPVEKDPLLYVKERFLELIRSGRRSYKRRQKELEDMDFISERDAYRFGKPKGRRKEEMVEGRELGDNKEEAAKGTNNGGMEEAMAEGLEHSDVADGEEGESYDEDDLSNGEEDESEEEGELVDEVESAEEHESEVECDESGKEESEDEVFSTEDECENGDDSDEEESRGR